MTTLAEYRLAAFEALDSFWFIQTVEEIDRTDVTLSLRLHIRTGLFVHLFVGELTGAINLALIEGDVRIFGLDYHRDRWHLHPFSQPSAHLPFDEPLTPSPLQRFLVLVRDLLLEHDLL